MPLPINARGEDHFGYRSEFINLAGLAQSLNGAEAKLIR